MTAPAVSTEVTCPKCGGPTWDNRATKNNPKAPDYKCRNRACDGVVWPPKGARAVAPKPAPATSHSMASKPNAQLPEYLQDAEQQDAAELSAKVGVDLGKFSKDLALYTALTEFVTTKIAPLYGNEQGIGMSPESAVAAVATLYIQAKRTP